MRTIIAVLAIIVFYAICILTPISIVALIMASIV